MGGSNSMAPAIPETPAKVLELNFQLLASAWPWVLWTVGELTSRWEISPCLYLCLFVFQVNKLINKYFKTKILEGTVKNENFLE